jgi:Rrf2 family nitric oxide-sensitive transcriptional repressor
MLSKTAEYALRAMTCLAEQPSQLLTTQWIAETSQVPSDYLAKVLNSLAEADLVLSQRGRNGGFSLARPAEELTVLEIVNAVDPIRRIPYCPLGKVEHGEHLCPLHRELDNAYAVVERTFAARRLADLIGVPSDDAAACNFPILAAQPAGR